MRTYLDSVWFAAHGMWLCYEGLAWVIDDQGNAIEIDCAMVDQMEYSLDL